MKYTGDFYSIDSRLLRVQIETPGNTSETRELKLGASPFVSSVRDDGKGLYAPIRCGGATVTLLSDTYDFNFYTGEPRGVKVSLLEGSQVLWTGYVSPTLYSQGYDKYYEEIALDCVDGIAVLKDIHFIPEGEHDIKTFLDIIIHCIKEAGCYKWLYVSDNVQLDSPTGTEKTLEMLRISTRNFADRKKDISQTDDDVAWSCYDVLKEMIQWLGMTLVSEGENVYILDYDAIVAGINSYHRYDLTLGNPSGVPVEAVFIKSIEGSHYAANGAKLSLEPVYNKITVKDEFNSYDNLFPAFGDENFETNLTAPRSDLSENFHDMNLSSFGMGFGDHIQADPSVGVYSDFVATISTDWTTDNQYLNFFKIMESPVFIMHKYDRETRADVTDNPRFAAGNFSYNDFFKYNGAFYFRWKSFDSRDVYDGLDYGTIWSREQKEGGYSYLDSTAVKMKKWEELFNQIKSISQVNMQPVILLLNDGNNRFGPGDEIDYNAATDNDVTKNYPFVTLRDKSSSSIFGGVGHFLRIKGKFCYHDEPVTPFPLKTNYNGRLKRADDKKHSDQGYIWCMVKWGDRWWDGNGWSATKCWFKLHYWNQKTFPDWPKNKNTFSKEFQFLSNNLSVMFFGEDGYIIPCPPEENLNGTPEVAFTTRDMRGSSRRSQWEPSGSKTDNRYCRYFSKCAFISDLQITAEVSPGLLSDADFDSDTCYTNVIDNGAVSPMDEFSFRVCTDDQKRPSYSSVDILRGGSSMFVTSTFNKALFARQSGTTGCDGHEARLRQEEHYVFKNATHYQDPKIIFQCCLHNDGNRMFGKYLNPSLGDRPMVITERETDWRFNSDSLTLTEV